MSQIIVEWASNPCAAVRAQRVQLAIDDENVRIPRNESALIRVPFLPLRHPR